MTDDRDNSTRIDVKIDKVTGGATGVVIYTHSRTGHLRLPWRSKLSGDGDLYNVLSWRYQLAPLLGRDDELRALLDWAREDTPEPRLHWLCEPGGSGKTRLAAELCQRLHDSGWAAGL